MPLRRLPKKKRPVPDYGLEIGDDEEVPEYGLEDLFGEQVQPQNNKQLVPKPLSYEDVLGDIASGEKEIYIDPEYMYEPEDLPPEYEEEAIDYNILEEDAINQALDTLNIPNYNDVELRLTEQDMDNNKRKAYLNKILKNAKDQRSKLTGYSTDVTKKLKSGLITEADAQYRRKVITDTRKVLTDYINYNNQRLKNIKGSGLKKKIKRGGQVQFLTIRQK